MPDKNIQEAKLEFVPQGTIFVNIDGHRCKILEDTTAHGCPWVHDLDVGEYLPKTLNLHLNVLDEPYFISRLKKEPVTFEEKQALAERQALEKIQHQENIIDIPDKVKSICYECNGWIVGGGAKYVLGLSQTIKDWDILVELSDWRKACPLIPHGTPSNSCGGFKIDGKIDLWPQNLGDYMTTINKNAQNAYAVHLKSGTFVIRNCNDKKNFAQK